MADPPRRGRPRDAGKRDAIVAAARALFLAEGADAVPLDAVIAAAGISKATFYANFADRSALLEAVIEREARRVVPENLAPDDDIPAALVAFGERLLTLLTDPDIIGFERLIAAATRAHPELPGRFFEAGPGRSRAALAALIARADAAGLVRVDDPRLAAEELAGLWQGMMRIEMSMAGMPPPDPAARRARVERGVAVFLRAYRPGAS